MKRVNFVIKMVVFFVLFGGMLLGVTTCASAAPAGCTATGHGGCKYDTITPFKNQQNDICEYHIINSTTGGFCECLDCGTYPDCYQITGNWTTATGEAICTADDFLEQKTYTFTPVGMIVFNNTGAKCN